MTRIAIVAEFDGSPRLCFWHPREPLLGISLRGPSLAWCTVAGQHVRTLEAFSGAWDSSGRHFVMKTERGVEDWLESAGQAVALPLPESESWTFVMHPRASLMIFRAGPQGLMSFNLETQSTVLFADSHYAVARRGRWSPSGHRFAAIESINPQRSPREAEACRLTMWTPDGDLYYRSESLPPIVFPPYWHPRGEACVLAADSYLFWWENGALTTVCPREEHRPWDAAAGWDASGGYLAVMAGPRILIFAADGRLHAHLETDWEVGFESLAWHPADPLLATGAWDSMIRLWSADGELLTTLSSDPRPGPPISRRTSIGTPMTLTWSADGAFLAAALREGSIYLYGIDHSIVPLKRV